MSSTPSSSVSSGNESPGCSVSSPPDTPANNTPAGLSETPLVVDPNAAPGEPSAFTSRTRMVWTHAARTALITQVWSTKPHLAGHGQKGKLWQEVVDVLGALQDFARAGGIKPEAAQKKYEAMAKGHRALVKSGQYISGSRVGEPTSVQYLIDACVSEEDEQSEQRQREEEGNAEREDERERRAEELLASASASSGSRPRKKRAVGSSDSVAQTANPAGNSPSAAIALEASMAEYFASKTESPAVKHRKLQVEETRASAELAAVRAREVEANSRSEMHEKEVSMRREEVSMRREEAHLVRESGAQAMAMVKDIVLARGESPDSKNHRKMIEAKDAETRRVAAEANREFQMKMLEMLAKKI